MVEKAQQKKVSSRTKKGRITRQKLLAKAVDIADKKGLAEVSMRKLAARFNVEAMSLYHHVKNKEDLFSGMVDLVLAEVSFDRNSHDWRASMRERAISTRQVLQKHPWALGLLESRPDPGPMTLAYHDSVIGVLLKGGFSLAMTAHAFSLLDAYTYGFIMQEDALPFDDREQMEMVAAGILASMPEGKYPHLKTMMLEHVLKPGYSFHKEFLYGLDMILDSLALKLP